MKKEKIYTAAWRKHLPVIKIYLKKDLTEEKSFTVNSTDFSVGRRPGSGFGFTIDIYNGKLLNQPTGSVVGDNLFELLESDLECKRMLAGRRVKIKMTPDFELSFKLNVK